MTAPTAASGATPVPRAAEPACDVCGHPVSSHDGVALRYCEATQHNALSRGCLCRIA